MEHVGDFEALSEGNSLREEGGGTKTWNRGTLLLGVARVEGRKPLEMSWIMKLKGSEHFKKLLKNSTLLMWLSGLSAGLPTKGSLVQFPVRAHALVVGQVPSRGGSRGNHTLMSPSLSTSFPLSP